VRHPAATQPINIPSLKPANNPKEILFGHFHRIRYAKNGKFVALGVSMEIAQLFDFVGRFPTTSAQQRFWFQEMAKPGDIELNIAVRWELRGAFRVADIERAMQIITDRHEMLRTRFVEEHGELWQEVVTGVRFHLGVVDLRAVSPKDHDARVAAMARELAAEPFDLTRPCQLRMSLVRLAPDRAAILIVAHHIAFDGFSIGVLGNELGLTVQALSENRAPDLPELALQYGDYALWEKELEASGAQEEDGLFWERKLKDAAYFELETDFPRPAIRTTTGKTLIKPFPAGFDARMTAFNKSAGISFFTLGAAVMSAALHRWSGKTDILFASPVAGRTDTAIEQLIGVFINTLALRIEVHPDDSLLDHISRVSAVVKEAVLHQAYPFDKVVRRLKRPRDASRRPLVSLNLNMQRVFLQERRYGAFEMVSVPSHMPGVFYDMNIQIIGRNAGWKLMIDYNDAMFSKQTVDAFADLLLATFDITLSEPARSLSTLPLRPQTRRRVPHALSAPLPEDDALPSPHDDLPGRGIVAPAVRQIWADILGIPVAECQGDFFELGGYSLRVLRMLARVEAQFGKRVPLAAFLSDPTLEGFSRALREALQDNAHGAAPQGTDGRVIEIMTLHPAHAGSPVIATINQPFLYHAMARNLSDDLEVANVFVPDEAAFALLKEMDFDAIAAEAARRLRARYGGRPMVLCGQCVDGLLGLRISQKLAEAGEHILAVAMIDTWEPGRFVRMTRLERIVARWTIRARRWGHYLTEKAAGRIGWAELFRKSNLGNGMMRRLGMAEPKTEAERLAIAVNAQLVRMSRKHPFDQYEGEVVLFKTRAHTEAALRLSFGWSGLLAADTPVYPLAGWHEDALLKSGVERISQVLEARVNRCREACAVPVPRGAQHAR